MWAGTRTAWDSSFRSSRREPFSRPAATPPWGSGRRRRSVPSSHVPSASWWRWSETAVSDRTRRSSRSEEHTSELQSRGHLVCRLLLEKKKILKRVLPQGLLFQFDLGSIPGTAGDDGDPID